ncbi:MAG TPA: thiamine pyrophosphate-dependent dehydrogenase E1 component subunit alpha [Candidatus Acidoferrum sp.]|nr:thiamine pyrophosphate-dependent dehydrogenase E1 component subunit alpha [Candidatus Acidoferrum sp.]
MDERFYRSLYRIRRVEEEIARVYPTDKIKSPVHLAIGQEAVSVGVCEALAAGDVVSGTYRSHALYLAKGGDLCGMVAELYAKGTGCARGKGGSMHLIDPEAGVLGTSAVVGTTIPVAVGYAYAAKVRGRPTVVASVFGDGAVEEGVFHESLNFAALRKIPVLFVCENNRYAIHAPQWTRQSTLDLVGRVRGYGIVAERVESGDVTEIHARAAAAVAAIRAGDGPRFLECVTYRWKEHVGPREDFEAGYRSRAEAAPWFERDEVARVGARLEGRVRAAIEAEVEAEIREAFAFAEASPEPEPAELYTDVFDNG